ncbi:PREDICTED: uncharacterized protein LOC105107504 [Populus euphratica]|uniref:Uncharacterized protein LOC105107504 n=1 Tax=Populus euphratica TaxID=75702 RepID=A0AAJ6SVK0_POPEU|nr:PREDICTED: uncharacterized protein LOC105107504 [Populus euphratica]
MAHLTIEDDFKRNDLTCSIEKTKGWVLSGSPQSMLCAVGRSMWWTNLKQVSGANSFMFPIRGDLVLYLNSLTLKLFKLGKDTMHGSSANRFVKPDREYKTFSKIGLFVFKIFACGTNLIPFAPSRIT